MATMMLKPIIEHLAINLIHNVKILLNTTIEEMAKTKQFKRFIEKLFLVVSNISLDATIKEMKQSVKTKEVKEIKDGESAQNNDYDNSDFFKKVKDKIDASSKDKRKLIKDYDNAPKMPGKTMGMGDNVLDFALKNPNATAAFLKKLQGGGGVETIDTTKYVIEPRIFPDINIPDITPELIKKFFYTPFEPFLRVMTCNNCNNGMFVRIKNKIICNLMKLFATLIFILFKTGIFNTTVVYGSFKKILDELLKNGKHDHIQKLIDIFEAQMKKNDERIEKIEDEEVSEFEDITGAEAHEVQMRKFIEERNKEIDKFTRSLEEAISEIKEDEYLPNKERKPDKVFKKMPEILGESDKTIGVINEKINPKVEKDENYLKRIENIKKNQELKKKIKQLLTKLRNLKSLPYYDESENKDPDLDPKKHMDEIIKEYNELAAFANIPPVAETEATQKPGENDSNAEAKNTEELPAGNKTEESKQELPDTEEAATNTENETTEGAVTAAEGAIVSNDSETIKNDKIDEITPPTSPTPHTQVVKQNAGKMKILRRLLLKKDCNEIHKHSTFKKNIRKNYKNRSSKSMRAIAA